MWAGERECVCVCVCVCVSVLETITTQAICLHRDGYYTKNKSTNGIKQTSQNEYRMTQNDKS